MGLTDKKIKPPKKVRPSGGQGSWMETADNRSWWDRTTPPRTSGAGGADPQYNPATGQYPGGYANTTNNNILPEGPWRDLARLKWHGWYDEENDPDPLGGLDLPRGYPTGPGGGGGGRPGATAGQQAQLGMLMQLLNSGIMKSPARTHTPDHALRGSVNDAVSADKAKLNTTFDALDEFLAGQKVAETPRVSATDFKNDDLSALIASQGGSDAGLRAQDALMREESGQTADAMNRYSDMIRSSQVAANQSRSAQAQSSRAGGLSDIDAQSFGLNALLDKRDADEARRIEEQNHATRLADRQGLFQLITAIGQLAGSTNQAIPNIDIDALLKELG